MASQAWLESSLRRSASLGLEVLERASRRSVDWTSSSASQTPNSTTTTTTTTSDKDAHTDVKRTPTELSEAFATIAEFMAQTSYQCKRFYESGCCTEPSDMEKNHVCRFHTQPGTGKTTSVLPTRTHDHVLTAEEDFYIEVSPGTYAITASMPELQQQTQLVSLKAGESVNLTFDL